MSGVRNESLGGEPEIEARGEIRPDREEEARREAYVLQHEARKVVNEAEGVLKESGGEKRADNFAGRIAGRLLNATAIRAGDSAYLKTAEARLASGETEKDGIAPEEAAAMERREHFVLQARMRGGMTEDIARRAYERELARAEYIQARRQYEAILPEKKGWFEKAGGRLIEIRQKMARAAQAVMLSLAVMGAAPGGQAGIELKPVPPESEAAAGKFIEGTKEGTLIQTVEEGNAVRRHGIFGVKSPDLTFITEGEDGKRSFNWWSLIAPLQLRFGKTTTESRQETFRDMHLLDPHFAHEEGLIPLSPENKGKVVEHYKQESNKEFVGLLHRFGFLPSMPGVERAAHGMPETAPQQVRGITITGLSSPEAKIAGPQSVMPGNKEKENENLAWARANSGVEEIRKQVEAQGMDWDEFREKIESVKAEEVQFTDDEYRRLGEWAAGFEGADEAEKIFHLIEAYNDKRINPEIAKELDQIVGSKRGVEITIAYEGEREDRTLVPFPVLLFLIPFIPKLRRKEKPGAPVQDKTTAVEGPPQMPPASEAVPLPHANEIPGQIRNVNLPPPISRAYGEMEERTVIDDIDTYLDHPKAVAGGVNYRGVLDSMFADYDAYGGAADREAALSLAVLRMWRAYDLNTRREANVSPEELEKGLDYESQPGQIQWAKMHARELIALVEERRRRQNIGAHTAVGNEYDIALQGGGRMPERGTDTDWGELILPRVRLLLQRRIVREVEETPTEEDAKELEAIAKDLYESRLKGDIKYPGVAGIELVQTGILPSSLEEEQALSGKDWQMAKEILVQRKLKERFEMADGV